MTDVFSRRQRSDIMSRVRSKGNKATELAIVALFRKHHISGWRRHPKLLGNPDFVFPAQRVALFVDGCFWHSCPTHGTQPRSNKEFWENKLQQNKVRDLIVRRALQQRGWFVLRIWQHEILRHTEARLAERVRSLLTSRAAPSSSQHKAAK